MAIPVAYNLRNLAVRKGTTLMTALGVSLTVAVLLTTLALVERESAACTGDAKRVYGGIDECLHPRNVSESEVQERHC
jgi:putative ABC transport system permease protein